MASENEGGAGTTALSIMTVTKEECDRLEGVWKLKKCYTNDDKEIHKAEIIDFIGSWLSGIATLQVKENGKIGDIQVENATAVRAFENAYGGIITAGHCADFSKIKGKKIFYAEEWGMMKWFIPEEQV